MTSVDALVIEDLSIQYGTGIPVVSHLDLRIGAGEIVGVIGESGCGKSSLGFAAVGLLPQTANVTAARLEVGGKSMTAAEEDDWNRVRGITASMIFQEPMSALNPCMTIGRQIAETLVVHGLMDRKAAARRAVELLGMVQVPEPEMRAKQFPHQLSGGMRQRVVIAMAVAADPVLLVADEPTTALDVTVQAQILDILDRMRAATGAGVLLISHDLGVIAQNCDRVVVMYAGEVVEEGLPDEVMAAPRHPYTRALMASIPTSQTPVREHLPMIPGSVSDGDRQMIGCRFSARCEFAVASCAQPQVLDESSAGHRTRCGRAAEIESLIPEEVPA